MFVPPVWNPAHATGSNHADGDNDNDDDEYDYFALRQVSHPTRLRNVLVMLFLGWPMYLIANVSGTCMCITC